MSDAVVVEVMGALGTRLRAHADRMLERDDYDCTQFVAEMRWLLPTSPHAQQQMMAALTEREIAATRFSGYVREHPAALEAGLAVLTERMGDAFQRLANRIPEGCHLPPGVPGMPTHPSLNEHPTLP